MKFTRLIISLFALLLLLLPLRVVAENIDVNPENWDYGPVEVGWPEPMIFYVTSIGPDTALSILDVLIVDDDTGSFELTSVSPEDPVSLPEDATMEIVVTFAPQAEGMVSASLLIVSNAHNYPYFYASLQGEGVADLPTPEEMMDELKDFYDDGVAGGTICGIGPGNSPEAKLRIFWRMLETADDLIAISDFAAACNELERAYLRSDGDRTPRDYIGCEGVMDLNAMIAKVMNAIECE